MEEREYLLSIITVCYNSEKTIKRTIDSIGRQLTEQVEYLIVDGKSTDQTIPLIGEAQKKYDFSFVSEPDNGIYDAMNKGMRQARGKWLLYINSDDQLKEGVLEKMLPVLRKETDCDCICTDVVMRRKVQDTWYSRVWEAGKADRKIYLNIPFCHQGIYIQKEKMESLGGMDCRFPIAGDWDLVCRLYLSGGRFRILHVQTAYFTEGGASNKWMVWEKHRIRVKNHMGVWIIYGFFWDVYHRIRSDIAKLLLGKKKDSIAVRKRYSKAVDKG